MSPIQDSSNRLTDFLAVAAAFTESHELHLVKYLAYLTLLYAGQVAAFYQLPGQKTVVIGGAPVPGLTRDCEQVVDNSTWANIPEISVRGGFFAFLSGVWKGRPCQGQPYILQGFTIELKEGQDQREPYCVHPCIGLTPTCAPRRCSCCSPPISSSITTD